MAFPIGEGEVRVKVNDKDLMTGLAKDEAEARRRFASMDRLRATPELNAKMDKLDKKLSAAEDRIKAFKRLRAEATLDADTDPLDRAIKKAEAEIKFLGAQKAEVKIDVDRARASQAATMMGRLRQGFRDFRVEAERAGVPGAKLLTGLGNVTTRIGPFTASLKNVVVGLAVFAPMVVQTAGALGSLISVLASATGGLLALGAAVGVGAIASFGGAFLAIKPYTSQLSAAFKASKALADQTLKYGKNSDQAKNAQGKLNQVLKGISPGARAAFKDLGQLGTQWQKLTRGARKPLFEGIAEGIKTAKALMPTFAKDSVAAVKGISGAFSGFAQQLRSGGFGAALHTIMSNFSSALPDVGAGLGKLLEALTRVGASASRFLQPAAKAFSAWSSRVLGAASDTDKLDSKVDSMVSSLKSVWNFAKAAGGALKALFAPGVKPGRGFLDDMTQGLKNFTKWAKTAGGQKKIGEFFKNSVQYAKDLWSAVKPIGKTFLDWAEAMRPFSEGLLNAVGALGKVIKFLSEIPGFKGLIQALAFAFVASKVIAFAGALRDVYAALKAIKLLGKLSILTDLAGGAVGGGALGKLGKGGLLKKILPWATFVGSRVVLPVAIAVTLYEGIKFAISQNHPIEQIIKELQEKLKIGIGAGAIAGLGLGFKSLPRIGKILKITETGADAVARQINKINHTPLAAKRLRIAQIGAEAVGHAIRRIQNMNLFVKNQRIVQKGGGAVLQMLGRIRGFQLGQAIKQIRAHDGATAILNRIRNIKNLGNAIKTITVQMHGAPAAIGRFASRASGGPMDPERTRGGVYRKPTFLVGDQRQGSQEIVISPDPMYRKQNQAYWRMAARMLGIPSYAGGGPHGTGGYSSSGVATGAMSGPGAQKLLDRLTGPTSRIEKYKSKIQQKEKRYDQAGRVIGQNFDETELLNADGTRNQSAIAKRMAQIQSLIVLKREIENLWGELITVIEETLSNVREVHDQLKSAFKAMPSTLYKTVWKGSGKKKHKVHQPYHNEAKDQVGEAITAYANAIPGLQGEKQDAMIGRDDVGLDITDLEIQKTAVGKTPESSTTAERQQTALEGALALAGATGGDTGAAQGALASFFRGQISTAQGMLADADPTNDTSAWAMISSAAGSLGSIPSNFGGTGDIGGTSTGGGATSGGIVSQMQGYSQARMDLMQNFGGNATPYGPGSTGRQIHITNNYQMQPTDPHTWSAQLGWELEALL